MSTGLNTKTIAGICFIIRAVGKLVSAGTSVVSYWWVLCHVFGIVCLGVNCFVNQRALMIVAGVFWALSSLKHFMSAIDYFELIGFENGVFVVIVLGLYKLAIGTMFIISGLNIRFVRKTGIISTAIMTIYSLFSLASEILITNFLDPIIDIMLIAGFALISVSFDVTVFWKKENLFKEQKTKQINVYDDLDQLLKLKSLLDNGVITQEEFDQKKKEYLDK